jgi:hypothetical protein
MRPAALLREEPLLRLDGAALARKCCWRSVSLACWRFGLLSQLHLLLAVKHGSSSSGGNLAAA